MHFGCILGKGILMSGICFQCIKALFLHLTRQTGRIKFQAFHLFPLIQRQHEMLHCILI